MRLCASMRLCGMPAVPLTNPQHHCANCAEPMHGALCGFLLSELPYNIKISRECLSERGQSLFKSPSAMICHLCTERLDGATLKSPEAVVAEESIADPNEAANTMPGLPPVPSDDDGVPRSIKKKRDEALYSLFVINPLPGGQYVHVICRNCDKYSKMVSKFNATHARAHIVTACTGVDMDSKRVFSQGSQHAKRAASHYAWSIDPSATVSNIRSDAIRGVANPVVIDLSESPPKRSKVIVTTNSKAQARLDSHRMFGPAMKQTDADKIIVAEVKAIMARGEPLERLLDDHVRAALYHRHPGIASFLPYHAHTIYNKYVVEIDQLALKEIQGFIQKCFGMITIAIDGAQVLHSNKVSNAITHRM
jgi:hypothetical protein